MTPDSHEGAAAPAAPAAPVPLHGPEHAADPQRSYDLLRRQGPVGRAEIAPGFVAHLVTDYEAALEVLQDSGNWSKDTRAWQKRLPEGSPYAQPVTWRPNLMFTDGEQHAHLRSVITQSLTLYDPADLRALTFRYADTLLEEFADTGRVDLVSQYAWELPLRVFNAMFGMPDEYGPQLVHAIEGMMSSDPAAIGEGAQWLGGYLQTLYGTKAEKRGHDLTSWFMDHGNGLSPEEVMDQVMVTLGAGNEPTADLIANTFVRLLTDDRYFSTLTTGSLPLQEAIDEALWQDSSVTNYGARTALKDVTFHGTFIPKGSPVFVSYAAANTCPHAGIPEDGRRSGNKAHLAWSAGPHACPARKEALLIATAAIERLLSYLPDIELAVPVHSLTYREGPYFRTLRALPVRFTPLARDADGATPWSRNASRTGGSAVPTT